MNNSNKQRTEEELRKFRKDWEKIRKWGDETAKRMGIKSYEDIERIAG